MKRAVKKICNAWMLFCAVVMVMMVCPVKADAAVSTFKAYYDQAKYVVNEANARYGTRYVLDADFVDVGKQLVVDWASDMYEANVQMPTREMQVQAITAKKDSVKTWYCNYRSAKVSEGMDALLEELIRELGEMWGSDSTLESRPVGVLPMEFVTGDAWKEAPHYVGCWSPLITYAGSASCTLDPVVKSGTHIESLYPGATKLTFDSGSNSCFAEKDTSGNTGSTTKKVTSIKITGESKNLLAGKNMQLTTTVSPSDASNKAVAWTVSNKKYATVSSTGLVKAKAAGAGKTITITAKAQDGSGEKATYKIKIKGAVKKIKLKASKTTIKPNAKVTIKATVTVGKGGSKTLKWTSSNKKYATVNSKGVVTAKKAGKGKSVTITAQAKDGSGKKATIKIKIK